VAAVAVFWSKGYRDTAIADLERATGLNRSSLYTAFGTKQAIFSLAGKAPAPAAPAGRCGRRTGRRTERRLGSVRVGAEHIQQHRVLGQGRQVGHTVHVPPRSHGTRRPCQHTDNSCGGKRLRAEYPADGAQRSAERSPGMAPRHARQAQPVIRPEVSQR